MDDFPGIDEHEKSTAKFLEYYNYDQKHFKRMVLDYGYFHPGRISRSIRIALFRSILNSPFKIGKIKEYIKHERTKYVKHCGATDPVDNLKVFMNDEAIKKQLAESREIEGHAVRKWFYHLHARFSYAHIHNYHTQAVFVMTRDAIANLPRLIRTEAECVAKIVLESCDFDFKTRKDEMVDDMFDIIFENTDTDVGITPRMCKEILRKFVYHTTELREQSERKKDIAKKPVIPFDDIKDLYDKIQTKHQFNKEYKVTIEEVTKRLLFRYHKTYTMTNLRSRVSEFFDAVVDEVLFLCPPEESVSSENSSQTGGTTEPKPTDDESKAAQSGSGDCSPQPGTSKSSHDEAGEQQPKTTLNSPEDEHVSPDPRTTARFLSSSDDEHVSPEPKTTRRLSFSGIDFVAMERETKTKRMFSSSGTPEPPKETTEQGLSSSDDEIGTPEPPKETTKQGLSSSDDEIGTPEPPKKTTQQGLSSSDDEISTPEPKTTRRLSFSGIDFEAMELETKTKRMFSSSGTPEPPKETTKQVSSSSDDEIDKPEPPKETTKQGLSSSDDEIGTPEPPKETTKQGSSSSDDDFVAPQPPKKAKH